MIDRGADYDGKARLILNVILTWDVRASKYAGTTRFGRPVYYVTYTDGGHADPSIAFPPPPPPSYSSGVRVALSTFAKGNRDAGSRRRCSRETSSCPVAAARRPRGRQ